MRAAPEPDPPIAPTQISGTAPAPVAAPSRAAATPGAARTPDPAHPAAPQTGGLSPREVEVLRYLAAGLTYPGIAERLIISVNTVRHHVKAMYGKLGVSSRAEALARAREMQLL